MARIYTSSSGGINAPYVPRESGGVNSNLTNFVLSLPEYAGAGGRGTGVASQSYGANPVPFHYTGAGYGANVTPVNPGQQYGDIAALMRQAQQQANLGRIPGAADLEAQSSATIGQQLKGEIPSDVLALLAQQGAERGIATGMPGSPNANAAYMRALGLTSTGLQQQGQQNLSAAYARNPGGPIPDASQQFISAPQQAQLALQADQMNFEKYKYQQDLALRQEAARRAASAMYSGGGGGGGGYGGQATAPATTQNFVSYPNLPVLQGSGSTPTSSPQPWYQGTVVGNPTYASQGSTSGYQPTTSGSSYIGSPQGVNAAPYGTTYNPFWDTYESVGYGAPVPAGTSSSGF